MFSVPLVNSFMNPTIFSLFCPNVLKKLEMLAPDNGNLPKVSDKNDFSYRKATLLYGHLSITRNTARENIVSASWGNLSLSFSYISFPNSQRTLLAPYSFVVAVNGVVVLCFLGGINPSSVIRPKYLPVFFCARPLSLFHSEVTS
ncbi:hypothetical protein SDC9_126836 [bioreactor metagenome]|uniref:Uncharacterized protein n=1 Tax=bioreactor metagenome TaxID=1076179 RepID=A0A645CSC1_9ZZZZ